MIALAAVHGSAHRVATKPTFEGCGLDPLIELERRIERRARGAVGDQFDRLEQAAPSDVADMPVIAEALGEPPFELRAKLLHLVEQMLLADDLLYLQRRGAGHRMRQIGMAVLERARALPDGVDDLAACEHGADRLIAAAQSLGDSLDIGRDAFLLPRVKRAGATHAAHHLVENQERAVAVADVAHGAEISLRRRSRIRRWRRPPVQL